MKCCWVHLTLRLGGSYNVPSRTGSYGRTVTSCPTARSSDSSRTQGHARSAFPNCEWLSALRVMTSPQNPVTPPLGLPEISHSIFIEYRDFQYHWIHYERQLWALLVVKGQWTITCLLSQRECRGVLWTTGPLKTSSVCRTQNVFRVCAPLSGTQVTEPCIECLLLPAQHVSVT